MLCLHRFYHRQHHRRFHQLYHHQIRNHHIPHLSFHRSMIRTRNFAEQLCWMVVFLAVVVADYYILEPVYHLKQLIHRNIQKHFQKRVVLLVLLVLSILYPNRNQ